MTPSPCTTSSAGNGVLLPRHPSWAARKHRPAGRHIALAQHTTRRCRDCRLRPPLACSANPLAVDDWMRAALEACHAWRDRVLNLCLSPPPPRVTTHRVC
eukprot:346539-Chlamydomonas_euryale.AAC.2